jgi:hypothetical protein
MYEVISGKRGTVYQGNNRRAAHAIFERYAGRAFRKQRSNMVTLFRAGVPVREFDAALARVKVD